MEDEEAMAALNASLAGAGNGCSALDDPSVVGTFSCHGREVGADEKEVGKVNQDCACVASALGGHAGTALLCVFDGHGDKGHDVSLECLFSVHSELELRAEALRSAPRDVPKALAATFESVQAHLRALAAQPNTLVNGNESGACAVCAVLSASGDEGGECNLWVANAGDCRAVLGTKRDGELLAVALSTDHKVDLPGEQARIEAAGGWVRPAEGNSSGSDYAPARVFESRENPLLGPGLAVSRTLGDLNAERAGVVPTPEVLTHRVAAEDRFVLLASDGVWEFIDMNEAVEIVDQFYSEGKRAIDACRLLIAKAALAWRINEGMYRDDITAIVAFLPPLVNGLNLAARQAKSAQVDAHQVEPQP